jgi:hypothetical protein
MSSAVTAHIRVKAERIRGNGFYKVPSVPRPPLCGAPATTDDLGWGDVRSLRGATTWQNGRADMPEYGGLRDVTLCPDCAAIYGAAKTAR